MIDNKISLQAAILMNINIMAGAGIFVGIVNLTRDLTIFGGILYLVAGLCMLPLIFTFAQLVTIYPSGGFYAFAAPINPMLGFISCWTYFFAKLASVALYLDVIARFTKQLIPSLFATTPSIYISLCILALYLYINCLNVRFGLFIQKCFVTAKTIPLFLLIALGIYHFDLNIIATYESLPLISFIALLPSALYCFSGFEAACSISRNIENAEKNAPKAILYSFFSIILIYVTFQSLISMMLAPQIENFTSYAQAYPYLMSLLPTMPWIQTKLATAITFFIAFSAMGAAYGILFSNSWNLYTLAQHNHVFGSHAVNNLNRYGIPVLAVLTEGVICTLFLWVTSGSQIPLQQISTLGGTITYTISSLAYLNTKHTKSTFLGILSLITCSFFIISCIISGIKYGMTSLYLFIIMFMVGLCMYFIQHLKNSQKKH